jgi:hypothetical protein
MVPARFLALLSVVSTPVLLVVGVLTAGHPTSPQTVYALASREEHLDRDPAAGVGRTALVRAVAEPCPWWSRRAQLQDCAGKALVLISGPAQAPAAPLPLVRPSPAPLASLLRTAPLLGDLLSRVLIPEPVPSWGVEATYAVRARVAGQRCGGVACFCALVVAAP